MLPNARDYVLSWTDRQTSELRAPSTYLVLATLVLIAAGSRMLQVLPNFSAVAAVAMFAGFFFRSRVLGIVAVVGAMLLSDLSIGGHDWRMMLVVYGSLCAPVFFSQILGQRPGVTRLALGGLLSAAVFFVVTNFAVWSFGGLYERSIAGLLECYVAAVPFARFTLAGDVLFSVAIFGAFYAIESVRDARALATA